MTLNDRVYQFLKYFITIALPAVGALYYAISEVWGFDRTYPVNATINAVVTFLGVLIGVSTRQYNKTKAAKADEPYDGDLAFIVDKVDGEVYPTLGVNTSLEEMRSKGEVRLQVIDQRFPEE
jgi:hypothetical protein